MIKPANLLEIYLSLCSNLASQQVSALEYYQTVSTRNALPLIVTSVYHYFLPTTC